MHIASLHPDLPPAAPAQRRRAAGMTLLEILFVAGVISGLLSVFVGVSETLVSDSARNQTLAILRSLGRALVDYRQAHGAYPSATEPKQMDTPMARCFAALRSSPATERIVNDIPDHPITPPRYSTVNDGFGNELVYVDPSDPAELNAQWVRRFPRSPMNRPFIVSAGEDGKFGDLTSSEPQGPRLSLDNLYSFELETTP